MVWALFIRKRDKSHRTHDWFVPFVARRQLAQQLRQLPRVAALQLHARQHQLLHRVPCREDSVIPSTLAGSAKRSLLPFSIFSGNSPRPSPRRSFPFYFPKPWRLPWFGGYEGCGLQGCFTHWLWKFFEIKKCLVDFSAAFAAEGWLIPRHLPIPNLSHTCLRAKIAHFWIIFARKQSMPRGA